jgi:hypothetical protein
VGAPDEVAAPPHHPGHETTGTTGTTESHTSDGVRP